MKNLNVRKCSVQGQVQNKLNSYFIVRKTSYPEKAQETKQQMK